MYSIINSDRLFPNNPSNDYYEKDATSSRSAICNWETRICVLGAVIPAAVIGSSILHKLNFFQISTEKLRAITGLVTVASGAIALGGLCMTRFQLTRLNSGPPLDPSNSLTLDQVMEILSRGKTIEKVNRLPKQTTDSLAELTSRLEQINRDTETPLVYFSPEQREECISVIKQIEDVEQHTRTKGEIVGILKNAKVLNRQRKKEWEIKWNQTAGFQIKSRSGPFSIKESEIGEAATIKWIKYPRKLVQIDHLICQLEKAIKGLDELDDTASVYIGEEANALILADQLNPIPEQQEDERTFLKLRRNKSKLNIERIETNGLRRNQAIGDFNALQIDAPFESEPN